jgi:NADPH2:quinone reductase
LRNVTVRLSGSDDLPEGAGGLRAGDLRYPIAARFPLERLAEACDQVSGAGGAGRVIVDR